MLLAFLQAVVIYPIILLSPSKAPQSYAADDEIVLHKIQCFDC